THNADGSDPRPQVRPTLHVSRPDESAPADEMTMVRGWLDHLRGGVYKLEGLDAEHLRWRPTPTANSLGGIVMHLGYAERLTHLVEEIARHAGHMDITRELIDGRTGR